MAALLLEKNKAHDIFVRDHLSHTKLVRWRQARKQAQIRLRQMEKEWWITRAKEIQGFADVNTINEFYNAAKPISDPISKTLMLVKSLNRELLRDTDEILQRWTEHFHILLNTRRPVDVAALEQLPQLQAVEAMSLSPTHQEVTGALKALKNNKSPGPDWVPTETLKYGGDAACKNVSNHSTGVGVGGYPNFMEKFQDNNYL